jgi:nitrogen fixation-related uncharacterized protein
MMRRRKILLILLVPLAVLLTAEALIVMLWPLP